MSQVFGEEVVLENKGKQIEKALGRAGRGSIWNTGVRIVLSPKIT